MAPLPRSILKPTISPLRPIPSRKPNPPTLSKDHTSPFVIPSLPNTTNRIALRTEEEQQEAARQREAEEKKTELIARRDARRKSLAARRVSFAPEATLHTWDVVEYVGDSTTSSNSTNGMRRQSGMSDGTMGSQFGSDPAEAPSTPPDQSEEDMSSPEDQRGLHQKKRRRSSAIPPLDFNNPDDEFFSSSSPSQLGSSPGDVIDFDDDGDSDSDEDETAMSIDAGEVTDTMASVKSFASDNSSDRLDAMLQLAARQAGTQGIDFDGNGQGIPEEEEEETEEISFKPLWQKKAAPTMEVTESMNDQENMNPFLFGQQEAVRPSQSRQEEATMTVEMTRAMGGILQAPVPEESEDDMTMEMTMTMDMTRAGGIILSNVPQYQDQTETMEMTRAVGRILPQLMQQQDEEDQTQTMDMTMDMTMARGKIMPTQPPKRQRSSSPMEEDDQTMDMTMDMTMARGRIMPEVPHQKDQTEAMEMTRAVSRISPQQHPMLPPPQPIESDADETMDITMDMTMAMGGILPSAPAPANKRRKSVVPNRRQSTRRISSAQSTDTSGGDETMEFTMVMGGIQPSAPPHAPVQEDEDMDESINDEGMTMEFTSVVGGVLGAGFNRQSAAQRRESIASENSDGGMDMTVAVGKIMPRTPEKQKRATPTPKTPEPLYPDLTPAKAARGMSSPPEKPKPVPMEPAYPDLQRTLEESSLAPQPEKEEAKRVLQAEVDQAELDDVLETPEVQEQREDILPAQCVEITREEAKQLLEVEADQGDLEDVPLPTTEPRLPSNLPGSAMRPPATRSSSRQPSSAVKQARAKTPDARVSSNPTSSALKPQAAKSPRRTRSKTPSSEMKPPSTRAQSKQPSSAIKPTRAEASELKAASNPPSSAMSPVSKTPEPIPSPAKRQPLKETSKSPSRKLPDLKAKLDQAVALLATPKKHSSNNSGFAVFRSPTPEGYEKDTENYKPVKGRKSLSAGAAAGLLGKRPVELDDEDSDDGGTKRLKNFQGSPVKNVRLGVPSKEDVSGRVTRAKGKSLEAQNLDLNTTTPTKFKTPLENSVASTPRDQGRFKDVEKLPEGRTPVPFKIGGESTMTIPLAVSPVRDEVKVPALSLQEFLDMTSIRFMELTTTKRRHTVAPNSLRTSSSALDDGSLESCVVAAACTLPMLELFQHSCHELKRYIAEGRKVVKEIEAETAEDNPPLFKEYLTADREVRSLIDVGFKNVKANARLQSKGMWYEWRTALLKGLRDGLVKIEKGFDRDDAHLSKQQGLLDSVLTGLEEQFAALAEEEKQLKAAAADIANDNPEDLAEARECLVGLESAIGDKQKTIAELRQQITEKDEAFTKVTVRKEVCLDEIHEAERIREECRGWTGTEVKSIRERVHRMEKASGWAVTGVSGSVVSMSLRGELECVFDAKSFKNAAKAPMENGETMVNERIDLWYIAASRDVDPVKLTGEKKFFVDSIRDHIRALLQSRTSLRELLDCISSSWWKSGALAEEIRKLNRAYPVVVEKTGDESIAVKATMLLPSLRSKVQVDYHISTGERSDEAMKGEGKEVGGEGMKIRLRIDAKAVYGERFNEDSMKRFLNRGVEEGMSWVEVVRELDGRLLARGKK